MKPTLSTKCDRCGFVREMYSRKYCKVCVDEFYRDVVAPIVETAGRAMTIRMIKFLEDGDEQRARLEQGEQLRKEKK